MPDLLIARLERLAAEIPQPDGETFAAEVIGRLTRETPPVVQPRRRWQSPPRRVAIGFALAGVALAATLALPGPRQTLARWFGFDRVRIERLPEDPSAPPTAVMTSPVSTDSVAASVAPSTNPAAELLADLGPAVSADVAAATGLPLPTPSALGEPLSLHVPATTPLVQIVAVYAVSDDLPASAVTGVGAIVTVANARANEAIFGKFVGGDTTVEMLDIDGDPAIWLSGAPHQVQVFVGDEPVADTLRLAANTLWWQRGELLLRIEASVSRDEAVRIARSWEPAIW
jgi:hypothetical protein